MALALPEGSRGHALILMVQPGWVMTLAVGRAEPRTTAPATGGGATPDASKGAIC